MGNTITNFKNSGTDIGLGLVDKAYLLDRYPELADSMKQAGLLTWGYNNYGQLGIDNMANKSSPVQTIAAGTNWKHVSGGQYHSTAIKTDGTLWLWGQNSYGQLGTNTITSQSSPVQTIAGGTNWKQVSGGTAHNLAIKTDGTLWVWGQNFYGQLGDNTNSIKSSPVQTIAAGTNWKQVSGGYSHSAAIKTDGTLWTWGQNYNSQLGNNSTSSESSPVQTAAGGTNWKQVACGAYHCGAIKTDGTLWMWGYNSSGQLGNNGSTNKGSPVQTIAAGTNWKQIACGAHHTGAIKTDGTLWMWGDGNSGELGNNIVDYQSSPVQTITGGTNWKQVSCSGHFSASIKTDGTLWLWGNNSFGQLGNNNLSITQSLSPLQIITGGTNWKYVQNGAYHAMTIRDDSADPF